MTLLVTGGAGFIGSNFVLHMLRTYPDCRIVTLDKMTYAADEANLASVVKSPRHTLVKGDIGDRDLVENLFKTHDIRGVIHFAAESHVDNSIRGPEVFFQTNVMGTFTLVDVARQYWMSAPGVYKPEYAGCRFHHISTDEVYGTLGETGFFHETTAYAPNSPYSASKAGSDFVVRAYAHTYGMDVVTTNCSNNYGPHQHAEKLIPTIIRSALAGKPIPIYGDGKNVRDWLYVQDHCEAIDTVFRKGRSGETYNVGGVNEMTNLEVVASICTILDELVAREAGSYSDLITFVADRAGHDRRYAIDIAKIKAELGWEPRETFQTGIRKTVEWYLAKAGVLSGSTVAS
ncbi:MAG: dTDP-glucose 4,6-dehydratase [Blastochloris viridis]|uniref:dTDP-glucose 4,6-dehydratase n=1 Tax=Blastochloris viridis TaxID=1079 RepID=A0A6N4R7E1_BLAVI|nr:MAG: dTDP-glucose 4,6-dehydratase [Blastochloris viridis]